MAYEKENYVKRNVKSSVFEDIFGNKTRLLELYKSLHPEDIEVVEDDILNVTIQNHMVNGIYNDLGFNVRDRLIVLVEAQSTWSVNIIPRSIIYMAKTLSEYFESHSINLYSATKAYMPEIELYVVYTGDRLEKPDKIYLSEEFYGGKKGPVEAEVRVLYGEGNDILCQYVSFCKIFDRFRKKYGYSKKAIVKTIEICKNKDILKRYLEERGHEVIDMVDILNDEEYIMRSYTAEIVNETTKRVTDKVTKDVTGFAIKSIVGVYKENNLGKNPAIDKIMKDYGKSEAEAQKLVDKYYD